MESIMVTLLLSVCHLFLLIVLFFLLLFLPILLLLLLLPSSSGGPRGVLGDRHGAVSVSHAILWPHRLRYPQNVPAELRTQCGVG